MLIDGAQHLNTSSVKSHDELIIKVERDVSNVQMIIPSTYNKQSFSAFF